MSKRSSSNGGIGFFGLLAIVFIILKLTHFIDWSWWLVLLPVLPGLILLAFVLAAGVIALLGFIIALIATYADHRKRKTRQKKRLAENAIKYNIRK